MSEHNPENYLRYLSTFQDLTAQRVPQYRRYFWIGATGFIALLVALGVKFPPETLAGALIIAIFALVPWWLWCGGHAKGLPIYPLFTLTATWAYALPLVAEHPIVVLFPPSLHLIAGISVAACLGVGTLAWWAFVRHRVPPPQRAMLLPMHRGKMIFWLFLAGTLGFNLVTLSGTLGQDVQGFTILRGVVLGIGALAVFFFGYQHGVGALSKVEIAGYLGFVALTAVVTTTSMLLVNAMTLFLTGVIAFMLGRGHVPWRAIGMIGVVFWFLHAGKSDQRERYWGEVMWRPIALAEYPAFFLDWAAFSLENIQGDLSPARRKERDEEKQSSLWERSSLMHLFLYFQYSTGTMVPHLWGLTYSAIPEMLIPRIFYAEKARAHFGNNVLAVHYGIVENSEDTQTSVGFGFINEGYANFGILGSLGATALLGAFFGWVSRLSMSVPLMSFRFLFAVIVLGTAFQVEYTAGVFVSSIFQATITLGGVALLFMRPFRLARAYQLVNAAMRHLGPASPSRPGRALAPAAEAQTPGELMVAPRA